MTALSTTWPSAASATAFARRSTKALISGQRVDLAARDDADPLLVPLDELERHRLDGALHLVRGVGAADEPLDGVDGVARIDDPAVLGRLADEHLAGRVERHERRDEPATCVVRQRHRLTVADCRDDGVGGPQVDPDCYTHACTCSVRRRRLRASPRVERIASSLRRNDLSGSRRRNVEAVGPGRGEVPTRLDRPARRAALPPVGGASAGVLVDGARMHFQDLILTLQSFWTKRGCVLVQPYNSEVGAGTYNPATFLRALGPEPWNVAFVEPSRRPTDGRYGENPNRLQQFHQFQVILKPSPARHPGPVPGVAARARHATRSSTTCASSRTTGSRRRSGAWGLGWQVWLDGLEITPVHLLPAGRRHRLPPGLRRADLRPRAHRDVPPGQGQRLRLLDSDRQGALRRAVCKRAEWEWSTYNFEEADVAAHFAAFDQLRAEAQRLLLRGPTRQRRPGRPQEGARPAGVRLRRQGGPPVQRARRARRHRRDRARALHRPRARARQARSRRRGWRSARRWASRCSGAPRRSGSAAEPPALTPGT